MLGHSRPAPNSYQFERAITRYYRDHPNSLNLAVTEVISKLDRKWTVERTYPVVKAQLAGEFDSDIWWNASPGNSIGIIRGFYPARPPSRAYTFKCQFK